MRHSGGGTKKRGSCGRSSPAYISHHVATLDRVGPDTGDLDYWFLAQHRSRRQRSDQEHRTSHEFPLLNAARERPYESVDNTTKITVGLSGCDRPLSGSGHFHLPVGKCAQIPWEQSAPPSACQWDESPCIGHNSVSDTQLPVGPSLPTNVDGTEALDECRLSYFSSFEMLLSRFLSCVFSPIEIATRPWR
jgi:hypothetical protein